MHTYKHAHIHIYLEEVDKIRSIPYIHTYIRTYIHTYIHTCIHTYIYTYIHTYLHTYLNEQRKNVLKQIFHTLSNLRVCPCMYVCTNKQDMRLLTYSLTYSLTHLPIIHISRESACDSIIAEKSSL